MGIAAFDIVTNRKTLFILTAAAVLASFQNCSNPRLLIGASSGGSGLGSTTYSFLAQGGSYGTGPGQFSSAMAGLGIDPSTHRIYVGDIGGKRILTFDSTGNYLNQIAGGDGTGDGKFVELGSIDFDPATGNMIVGDWTNARGQIFSPVGAFLAKFNFLFNGPRVAVDPTTGNLIVVEMGNARANIIDRNLNLIRQFGSSGMGPGQFSFPGCAAIDPRTRNIVIADFGNSRFQIFDSNGAFLRQFGAEGSGNGQFNAAFCLAIDPVSGHILIADQGNHRIQIFDNQGNYLSQFGTLGSGPGQFDSPGFIAIDRVTRNIVVLDNNWRFQIFQPDP